jgi:hypothetical protein
MEIFQNKTLSLHCQSIPYLKLLTDKGVLRLSNSGDLKNIV